ncbi:hypothetical protein [Candidatus Neptunochlamydia vexilliferae]|uniref:Lipoprotein n=1 Tax=Candidatus Neptunichlamydia vexilliferae TaxID=1651774 RepID=A0ABS0AZA6_9BACT|nr:hypothetical protein [Candidatus Neptunochlamydia vexilliferae]MBF5059459.1 hypothetical protein [Candidatus Neptunochlamydia vexilliferae]
MKKLFFLFLLLAAGCSRPQGFTLKKIVSRHPAEIRWDVLSSLSEEELATIFDQSYTYLGSGNHTYAFASRDGNYVIKFFKQKHMRTQSWVDYLPLPAKSLFYPIEKIKQRTEKREKSFTSYKIAYEKLREETGLLYLHLNQGTHLGHTLTLMDQWGNPLEVKVDEMEFLVQKRATLAFDHLKMLLQKGERKRAVEAISSLLEVVAKRSQKGIYDRDLQFFKNFGFLEDQAIEIDIGEFKEDQVPLPAAEELQILSYQIRDFVQAHAPEFVGEVCLEMENQVETYR